MTACQSDAGLLQRWSARAPKFSRARASERLSALVFVSLPVGSECSSARALSRELEDSSIWTSPRGQVSTKDEMRYLHLPACIVFVLSLTNLKYIECNFTVGEVNH